MYSIRILLLDEIIEHQLKYLWKSARLRIDLYLAKQIQNQLLYYLAVGSESTVLPSCPHVLLSSPLSLSHNYVLLKCLYWLNNRKAINESQPLQS